MQTLKFFNEISTNRYVQIVPFHWAHPRVMDLRPFDREYYDVLPNYDDMLRSFQAEGNACTALYRGKIFACFGTNILWPGVGEGWLLTGKQVDTLAVSVTRCARRYFNHIATTKGFKRLQLTVNAENELAVRWAYALQFTREGLLRNYGPTGADHIMFARIYE